MNFVINVKEKTFLKFIMQSLTLLFWVINSVTITFLWEIMFLSIHLVFAVLIPVFVTTKKSVTFVNLNFLSGKERETCIFFFLIMILALYVSCSIDSTAS